MENGTTSIKTNFPESFMFFAVTGYHVAVDVSIKARGFRTALGTSSA